MSQNIFDEIIATSTSGTELATILNEFKDAVASGFSGDTSRPANLQQYGYWIKYNDPDDGLLAFNLYDGTQDIELFQINKTTANVILSSSEDTFNIIKNSDDAIGPDINMKKGRITGNQTLDADVLGNIKWTGRDGSSVEYTQAKITTTALEDVTSGAHGANIAFYVTTEGTSSLVKAVTISDEKKLGIGVDDPTMMVETFDTSANAGYKATIAQDSTTGPSMTLHKKRVTTNGQVLTGDTIGNFKLQSTDNAGAEIPAGNIKAVAAENHLATQGGTNIIIERVKLGETALSTAVTVDDDGVTIAEDLTVTGDLTVSGTGAVSLPGDLTVSGDLTVNGDTTTVNTATLDVEDANITINNGGSDATSEGAGITVERTGTDGSLVYEDALTSKFKIGADGSEVEVADVSSTQTFTNKTLTSPAINTATVTTPSVVTPSRLDVKQDTRANLETYASSASNGQLCFATDDKKMFQVVDSALTEVGSGGVGDADTIEIIGDESKIADWDITNLTNATFSINETTPLNGDNDFKFTNVTGSVGEYILSKEVTVPLKSRGRMLGILLASSYGGADDDFSVELYDETNDVVLGSKVYVEEGASKRMLITGFSQSTTASVRLRSTVEVVNNGKILYLDDIVFTGNPFPVVEVYNSSEWTSFTPTVSAGFGTVTNSRGVWRRVGDSMEIEVSFTSGTVAAVNATIDLPGSNLIDFDKIETSGTRNILGQYNRLTTNAYPTDAYLGYLFSDATDTNSLFFSYVGSSTTAMAKTTGSGMMLSGETILLRATVPIDGWKDTSEGVVHTGTFPENNFSARIAGETGTTVTSDNGDFILSVVKNGTGGFTVNWVSGFFTVAPSVVAVAEDSVGNVIQCAVDAPTTSSVVVGTNAYAGGAGIDKDFTIHVSRQGTDYKPLTGTIITPLTQTAYIKDVKTSGTAGGTFTAGVQTRDLNVLNEDGSTTNSGSSFVNLSANQFTLSAGKYLIKAKAPAQTVNKHQAKLVSDPDSLGAGIANVLIGSSENSNNAADYATTHSFIEGTITITESTIFEIQHYGQVTRSTDGFGNIGDTATAEVYTQVEITKLK